MHRRLSLLSVVIGLALLSAVAGRADVPAPPVNQTIGTPDVALGDMTEADCRACHDSGVPDRHHLLTGQPIPPGSLIPYPDADGDGANDTVYGCLNCHDPHFPAARDCIACHTGSAHHTTPAAQAGDCKSCHGDLVDNIGDGHYIPTYEPSLVTPSADCGTGLPNNSRGNGAGACDYCHDDDGLSTPIILTNPVLHHGASSNCSFCHSVSNPTQMRVCEGCHGPDSLHNIQADSPRTPTGTIVVGGEDAGYGHVGRDAGPGDSDCWGCHGFAMSGAPGSGPLIPTIYSADLAAISAGADTIVVLSGSAFTNFAAGVLFESNVTLTAADGASVTLTPDLIDQALIAVTVPGGTAPGNYELRVVKADFESNPAPLSVVPRVVITGATADDTVTIQGSGFGGYAEGSGTSVTGTVTGKSKGRKRGTSTLELATIVSWSDTKIEANFVSRPEEVTVYSVFGEASSKVVGAPPDKGRGAPPDRGSIGPPDKGASAPPDRGNGKGEGKDKSKERRRRR